MSTADLLLAGGSVFSHGAGESRPSFKALDLLVDDGRITALEPRGRIPAGTGGTGPGGRAAARQVVDVSGRLVLPGLVNAHSHSYGQVCRHAMNDDTLEAWLPRAIAYAQGMTPADSALAARLHAADALRHGVTLVLDHARLAPDHVEAAVDAYEQSGLRVALAPQIGDRTIADSLPALDPALHAVIAATDRWPARTASDLLAMMRSLARRTEDGRFVRTLVGPSTAERCTPELLAGLSTLAREHGLAIHTHLLESRVQRRGGDPLGVLESAGLLGPRTTLAHCVHLNAVERARIADAGATVVHNPLSNLAIGSGYFDLRAALDAKVRIAFGTDAFNCGGSQDWLASLRVGVTLRRPDEPSARWVRPADAWWSATENAAAALGFGDVTGRLAQGLAADFLVVNPAAAGCYEGPDWLEQLAYSGFGGGLERVYVGGRLLAQDGRPLHLDEAALAREAAAAYERLQRTTRDDQAVAAALRSPLTVLSELAAGRTPPAE